MKVNDFDFNSLKNTLYFSETKNRLFTAVIQGSHGSVKSQGIWLVSEKSGNFEKVREKSGNFDMVREFFSRVSEKNQFCKTQFFTEISQMIFHFFW